MTRDARAAAILFGAAFAAAFALFWTPVIIRAVYHAMIGA